MQKRLSPVKTGLKAIYYGALTFSLFLIHFYALSARSVAEQDIHKVILSLEFENATLYEAFDQLEKASGFHVVYNRGMIDANKRINYIASNKTLAAILSKILGEEYQFNQIENNIVISNKSVPHFREGWGIIQGTITDKDTGDPLIGANVWIDALTTGTTTNISGDYRLEQVPEGTYVVMISYIGYITQTIRDVQVNQKEVTKIDISLAPSVMRLSDVVVEGTIDVKNVDVQNTTELEMIDQIKTSNLIVTGISNEQIIRSLDFNASEVV
ncbi:MAG: carboxypeptidase-like regulatory domain-containing protein, partial [Cytophagales bacterium]|nr:carboxypeptidase-like regulatory domain-containing protein [Cytophagales bacterium]